MRLGAYPIDVDIIAGIIVTIAGGAIAIHGHKLVQREERLRRTWVLFLAVGAIAGFALSWVPWPIEHELPAKPGVIVQMWGIPAPMAMRLSHGGHSGLFPSLYFLAWPLNMLFGAGVAQLLFYGFVRRRRRRTDGS